MLLAAVVGPHLSLVFSTHISNVGGGGSVLSWLFHQTIVSPIILGHAAHTVPEWSYSLEGTMVFLLIMINLKPIHVAITVATTIVSSSACPLLSPVSSSSSGLCYICMPK